jgi:hypothetical protein
VKLRVTIAIAGVLPIAALATACRKEAPRTKETALASASTAATLRPPSASAEPAVPTTPAQKEPAAVKQVVERWNRATNEGDGKVLAELYAEKIGLYGRMLTREQAVTRKLEALRKSPGFSQTMGEPTFTERPNADQEASFVKTSGGAGRVGKVRAYLLLRFDGKAWQIVDEGDAASRRTSHVIGQDRFFHCECQLDFAANPDEPEPPPLALPPLGPAKVTSKAEPPPGAPRVIEYASLSEERFAMSNDVPLFVTVTNLSTNGDGRWYFFDLPGGAGAKRRVLDCSHGGFWYHGSPRGTPDPGYPKSSKMKSTEALERDERGVHYQKTLYAPDGIESHVDCRIDPEYEAYFMPIVRRAGSTLRADVGGQYDRVPLEGRAEPATEP